jgi:polysaccharide export outer membrane protein
LFKASVLAVCACVAGCAPGADLPLLSSDATQRYQLGVGDEVRLLVYDAPQMSGSFIVGDNGALSLPLLGQTKAAGLSSDALQDEIAQGLRSRRLLVDPSVSIDITRYRPIYILGEVEHPGSYPYQPGLTMLSAVAIAGGFTYRGVTSRAQVVRTVDGHSLVGRVGPASFLQPGDVMTIYERVF